MNMPRVVCPTTEWILTKRSPRSYMKKRMPRAGDSVSTTQNQTLRDHPKSCPNDRNYIAGFWIPDIQSDDHRFISILKANAHENHSHVSQPVNHALWLNPALWFIWKAPRLIVPRLSRPKYQLQGSWPKVCYLYFLRLIFNETASNSNSMPPPSASLSL